ncbi:aspartic peptidase domain-containing protein [Lanmaoa asiatica]|nr:aspartic peptidase domain-containing protein [Lanmaoa asiatica]
MSDTVFNSPLVPILYGTPPQLIDTTLDLNTAKLAVYSSGCVLCGGNTSFDPTLSTTFQALNYSWPYNTVDYFGNMSSDTMSFGGILSLPQTEFGLIETGGSNEYNYLIYNGRLGIFPDPVNATAASEHFLSQLYTSNQLLNPVIGMKLDPSNPKITIGALDDSDYQGNLNWVPIITPNDSWSIKNIFTMDGLKGYNSSFLPNSSATYATVDSVFIGVSMPQLQPYLGQTGYAGPINYTIEPVTGIVAYVCNSSEYTPFVALTATINGVDYPMDSTGNLLRTLSPLAEWGRPHILAAEIVGIEENCCSSRRRPFVQGVPFPHRLVSWVLRLRISVGKYQSHFITNHTDAHIDAHAECSVPHVYQPHSNTFAKLPDGPTNANVNSEISGVGRADGREFVRRGRLGG